MIAIIPTADRSKATVKVRVAFKRGYERILPEMGARVSFLDDARQDNARASGRSGVIVPADAVQAGSDTGIVFVLRDDRVEARTVKLGAHSAQGQILLSGIDAGTRLAIAVSGKLSDGAKVRAEKQ